MSLRAKLQFGQDVHAVIRIELFIVSAVSAVLITRGYLILMGYPQIGSGGLHIAHMLWGGLLMLVSHVLLLGFLGPRVKGVSAVVGGVGFGLFIDEVGKFVTSDNDYFFQPSFAIMYVVFVALVLVMHRMSERSPRDAATLLANAATLGASGQLHGLDDVDRADALQMIALARGRGADDRAARAVQEMVEACSVDQHGGRWYASIRTFVLRAARGVVRSRSAYVAVVAILVFQMVDPVGDVVRIVFDLGYEEMTTASTVRLGWLLLTVPVIVTGFVTWWRRSEEHGLQVLRYVVLLNIMVGQVFNFADRELDALPGVLVNLGSLAVVNYRLRMLEEPSEVPAPARLRRRSMEDTE
ncbi:hypothetical protein [Phytoactinopolyspora halotolerans]|uniref:Uncharacterized protein n=1 Tax=Phytoactinopolyspora halotolerans TaxID=1981512 RepID=A0A6L9S567_9ACTN|nr:hypothetical protein [Phytoactinopolyspora halotolerans]NEE00605.1 hypothetical protein [Phytoactinopolyspora halotolerans]